MHISPTYLNLFKDIHDIILKLHIITKLGLTCDVLSKTSYI